MTFSDLPSVHEVLTELGKEKADFPHELIVAEIRSVLQKARDALRAQGSTAPVDILAQVKQSLQSLARPSLQSVINATGVVLHTNLGRAPLPNGGYSNLEYNLAQGRRGRRDAHTDSLLGRVLGAPGIVVNNNAAAVYLILNELAANREVIVSRGELIEIGDGFRIPDIMARSGAILREVGTTNRTRLEDYQAAITDRTALIMLVHPSNFRISGFTSKPERAQIAALARERNIPLYEDLGSGCLADLRPLGIDEPRVQDSFQDQVDLVSFSGDKLLGGPQAGIIAGNPDLLARIGRNPMYRALRVDKLIIEHLERALRATLLERWDDIPALRMIRASAADLRPRAERIAQAVGGTVIAGESVIGGGSTPEQSLPTWLVALPAANANACEARLRAADPPVIARIENDRVLLDPRTIAPGDEPALIAAVTAAIC